MEIKSFGFGFNLIKDFIVFPSNYQAEYRESFNFPLDSEYPALKAFILIHFHCSK